MTIPTIGRVVIYTCSADDAAAINRRRQDARDQRDWPRGAQLHVGNPAEEGHKYPAIVVATWGSTPECAVNLKVLLDGTDELWATTVCVGEGPRTFAWPVRA